MAEYSKPVLQEVKPFPGYDNQYFLTPQGEVWSLKTNKKLAIQEFKEYVGYPRKYHREKYVTLSRDGKPSRKSIRYWLHKLYPKRFEKPEGWSLSRFSQTCYSPYRDFLRRMEYHNLRRSSRSGVLS